MLVVPGWQPQLRASSPAGDRGNSRLILLSQAEQGLAQQQQ